ncbi:MAG: hypothetical protein QOE14_2110 [Humisphaera sp.]|nr:hypothetical protein [Humisphaera sp.]
MQTESPIAQDESPTPWETVTPDVYVYEEPPATKVRFPSAKPPPSGGGAFTIPLICLGIGVIAMCLLIPAADEVRKLAYERDRLQADLDQLQKQVDTNDSFLHRVANDPVLAERLARRQMKMVPEGTAVLNLKMAPTTPAQDMSPFLLVTVPPPAPMPEYRAVGGVLANACRHPKTQLYLIGGALMAIASGLVLSRSSPPSESSDAGDAEG